MAKDILTTADVIKEDTELPVSWNGAMCDDCGVVAVYSATKDGFELNFCGHHVRQHAESLKNQGFTITPDRYQF